MRQRILFIMFYENNVDANIFVGLTCFAKISFNYGSSYLQGNKLHRVNNTLAAISTPLGTNIFNALPDLLKQIARF